MTLKVNGYEWEVNYTYSSATRGARERGTGMQLEPDESSGVEIEGIMTSEDVLELLDQELIDEIAHQIKESIEDLNYETDC